MREISRFLGVFVFFCNEKTPDAHIHVRYNEHQGIIKVNPAVLMSGYLPPRVLALMVEWITINTQQLQNSWDALQRGEENLPPITPLL
jgi:hypothetical protein